MNLFKINENDSWQSLNDGVMGGVSKSQLTHLDKLAVFSGHVSLDNNGGFASVNRRVFVSNVALESELTIRVMGDGKRYQLRLKSGVQKGCPSYSAGFTTQANVWQTFRFKLNEFKATLRGKRVPDAPKLNWLDVQQLGFFISDRQEGEFCLLIDSISLDD
ncbi:NADH:ubiquinone oxidoreductase complex I intermediate-associated protein 30 [Paraglaciecola polaris LMG 21857]|uniref:NADH:ubiquinone oxidoreductase complex I intermediate-associated protein 30 n=2 Tax=Paraglaciecola polaris TaxID=222814 RepID=K6YJ21_9ALTE|nr:NADH:ubiquinone oxidoreductase complex I intermediate-associated protein 30 [Paraglaciecola polaris LMG 21857]